MAACRPSVLLYWLVRARGRRVSDNSQHLTPSSPSVLSLREEEAMSRLDEVLALVKQLSPQERAQLARALGGSADLPLASPAAIAMSRPDVRDPVGWRKAEAGHAVLAIDTPERDEEIPAGPK